MEIFLIRLLQFMLAISLLVLLHEGGHFFFARLFGVWVEKFYLFFDVTVGKWDGSIFKTKKDKAVEGKTTQYGVGWLPLGGYCKIAGMIDESFDTEQMKQPVKPYEFRAKPAWQRLLIMIGGVLVNFLLALFIYSMILFHWGDTYVPLAQMTQGMEFNDEAKALGFQDGDVLLATDRGELKKFGADMFRQLSEATTVTVLRHGEEVELSLPGDLNLLDMLKSDPVFARVYLPAVVDSVLPGMPAAELGLQRGDSLLQVGNRPVASFGQLTDELARMGDVLAAATTAADSMKARQTTLVYQRDGRTDTVSVTLTADLKLGFVPVQLYEPVTREYGFFESFPAGIKYGWHVLASYVDDMKYVFTADGAKSLGGFGAIGSLFPSSWDWHRFWEMTAFLSIILAFMNILPIPALDGGHVLFLIYEMVTRRKPSEQFMIRAEYFGFGLIILLMVVANLNDILRWLGYM